MAVLLVLLLLSITFGLSYAMVRSQNMAMHIARNTDRRALARQAALTGLSAAIRSMQKTGWAGVASTLSGTLSTSDSFQVTYTTGDPRLTSSSSDYSDYPYRVTVLSTGSSSDPIDSKSTATYKVQAVMRLVPRAVSAEPAGWSDAVTHTLYQYMSGSFAVNVPFHAEGKVRSMGTLDLAKGYGWSDAARKQYMADLNLLRLNGNYDWRPLTGPIYLPYSAQETGIVPFLNTNLSVSTVDTAGSTMTIPAQSTGTTYQLYPGGKSYTIPALGSSVSSQTYQSDPINNPAGLFYRSGAVSLGSNTTLRGTLIARTSPGGNVTLAGSNVQCSPVDLPPLYGSTAPVRLPTIIAEGGCYVNSGADGTLTGLVVALGDFQLVSASQYSTSLSMPLRVIARYFKIDGRTTFNKTAGWWTSKYNAFMPPDDNGLSSYFPWYVYWYGFPFTMLDPTPQLVLEPDTTAARYSWTSLQNPIYCIAAGDDGLRWEMLYQAEQP